MSTPSHSEKKHLKKDVAETTVYRGMSAKHTPDYVVAEFRRVTHIVSARTRHTTN